MPVRWIFWNNQQNHTNIWLWSILQGIHCCTPKVSSHSSNGRNSFTDPTKFWYSFPVRNLVHSGLVTSDCIVNKTPGMTGAEIFRVSTNILLDNVRESHLFDELMNNPDKSVLCTSKLVCIIHDTRNWTKNVSPSRKSLKNGGTDISRSTICLAKFARH